MSESERWRDRYLAIDWLIALWIMCVIATWLLGVAAVALVVGVILKALGLLSL